MTMVVVMDAPRRRKRMKVGRCREVKSWRDMVVSVGVGVAMDRIREGRRCNVALSEGEKDISCPVICRRMQFSSLSCQPLYQRMRYVSSDISYGGKKKYWYDVPLLIVFVVIGCV